MIISPNGIELLKHFESCKLTAYQDGGGVWTIGWGHTGGVKPGQIITQKQADTWLAEDLSEVCIAVTTLLGGHPTQQHQFDAFVSFAYNVGLGPKGFAGSTMLAKYKSGQYAADEFMRWVKDNGQVVAGLGVRRACERMLFKGKNWREGI